MSSSVRRSSRKKVSISTSNTNNSVKPPVRKEEQCVEDVYCQGNKLTKFNPSALETIYESPKRKNSSPKDFMGAIKLRRECRFTPFYNPSKIKLKSRKRRSLALKRNGVKVPTGFNVTIEQLKSVLESLHDDESNINSSPQPSLYNRKDLPIYQVAATCPKSLLGKAVDTSNNSNISNCPEMEATDMKSQINVESQPIFSAYSKMEVAPIQDASVENREFAQCLFESDINCDSNLEISFTSQSKDKKRHNRRRSRKHEPLVLTHNTSLHENDVEIAEKDTDLSNLNDIVRENPSSIYLFPLCSEDPTKEKPFHNLKNTDDAGSMFENVESKDESELSSTLRERKESNVQRGKWKRRNSGVTQSLYKNVSRNVSFDNSFADPAEVLDDSGSSPSSMLRKLKICSPNVEFKNPKQGRRKSARLSAGTNLELLGSFWLDKRNENTPPKGSSSSGKDTSGEVFNGCMTEENQAKTSSRELDNERVIEGDPTKKDESESSTVTIVVKNEEEHHKRDINLESNVPAGEHSFFHNSPIISGSFNGMARVSGNGKVMYTRESNVNLKHFAFRN